MRVLLVCMPFGPVFGPSLGLSLLKACLSERGVDAGVRYFSIDFAELIGQHFYSGIADGRRPPVIDLAGDWIFAAALDSARPDGEYVKRILEQRGAWPDPRLAPPVTTATIRRLQEARCLVDGFLASCVTEIADSGADLVGFSSVFQQQVASLALARRLKAKRPETFIVFGGANCEGIMGAELVRQFPFVNAAVSGEGEIVFPELVARVRAGMPVDDLPGVRTRTSVSSAFAFRRFPNAPSPPSLDALPPADFSDYMRQFRASRFGRDWTPSLPFETSRGCWWGARHHCTFCGLNGSAMAFRSKSPTRALDELLTQTRRYPGCDVQVVDNILDMNYFTTLLPALARQSPKLTLFYETKANLRKDQIHVLRDAGVTSIQPGIESFSDPVLKLMRKGVTALQNIQLLKWCQEIGVRPIWNVIWGIPGEPIDEYARMTALVNRLTHLPPPSTFEGLRLDRFSPNFEQAAQLGFSGVRPLESYRFVYALPESAIRNLAYFFRFDTSQGETARNAARPFLRALRGWQRRHRHTRLLAADLGDRISIRERRHRGPAKRVTLRGLDRTLFLACDRVMPLAALIALGRAHACADEGSIQSRLAKLVARGLMVCDGEHYLSIAVLRGRRQRRVRSDSTDSANYARGPA